MQDFYNSFHLRNQNLSNGLGFNGLDCAFTTILLDHLPNPFTYFLQDNHGNISVVVTNLRAKLFCVFS